MAHGGEITGQDGQNRQRADKKPKAKHRISSVKRRRPEGGTAR